MDVLQIVMPVLVMIILGMLCRKWKILTGEGVANMKVLVTNVMLPVAIFHALATAGCFLQPWICAEALSQGKISEVSAFYGKRI